MAWVLLIIGSVVYWLGRVPAGWWTRVRVRQFESMLS